MQKTTRKKVRARIVSTNVLILFISPNKAKYSMYTKYTNRGERKGGTRDVWASAVGSPALSPHLIFEDSPLLKIMRMPFYIN